LQRGQGAAQQAYLQKQQEEGDNGLGRVLGTVAGTVLGGPIGGTIGGEAGAAIGGHEVDADALANSLGQAANSLGQAAMGGVGQKQSILPDMETGGQLGIGGMDTGALPTMQTGAQLGAGKMKQVIGYDSSGNPIYSPM